MSRALQRELESRGLISRPKPAPEPAAPAPGVKIEDFVLMQAEYDRKIAALTAEVDRLKSITTSREYRFEVVRDRNGDMKEVIARPL